MTKPKPISDTSEEFTDMETRLTKRLMLLEERIAALERIAAPIVEEKAKEVLKDGTDTGT